MAENASVLQHQHSEHPVPSSLIELIYAVDMHVVAAIAGD